MVKKVLVLATMACMVAWSSEARTMNNEEIQEQIEKITREFNERIEALQAQMAETKDDTDELTSEIEEKSERWDFASRVQLSGDIRNRLDYHGAETAAYYPATSVASGIYDIIDIAGTNGLLSNNGPGGTVPLANFGLTTDSPVGSPTDVPVAPGDPNGTLLGQLLPQVQAGKEAFVTAATGAGLTIQQATDAFALFSDPTAGALVAQFGAQGLTVGQLLGAMSSPKQLAGIMKQLTPSSRASIFSNMANAYSPTPATDYENDSLITTRLRLNMRVKATENVEMKARLAMFKTWGMQDSPMPEVNENGIHDTNSPYFLNSRTFDGTSTRQPQDNILRVDRAYMNWTNIGDLPVWFSIGRRPTTDGSPSHLRLGLDQRQATPVAFMDYAFDGFTLGYAYQSLGSLTDAPGRIRFCAGRGFEAGPQQKDTGISDVDFAGINWDVYQKGDRFINIQSFGAFNLFNVPGDTFFPNPLEIAQARQGLLNGSLRFDPTTGQYLDTTTGNVVLENTFLDRINMGNVYHTSGVYMDKVKDLNYFIAAGWTRTDPKATDEMGITLLGDFWAEPEDKDGYAVYLGGRYDIPDTGFKIGAEFNYGSKNWLGFTPAHDDIYAAKLYTRGSVYEIYGIWDLPVGEAISRYGKVFTRLGYQYYDYDYTYSGMWLGTPTKIEDLKNDPSAAQFYAPFERMDNIYLTIEGYF